MFEMIDRRLLRGARPLNIRGDTLSGLSVVLNGWSVVTQWIVSGSHRGQSVDHQWYWYDIDMITHTTTHHTQTHQHGYLRWSLIWWSKAEGADDSTWVDKVQSSSPISGYPMVIRANSEVIRGHSMDLKGQSMVIRASSEDDQSIITHNITPHKDR